MLLSTLNSDGEFEQSYFNSVNATWLELDGPSSNEDTIRMLWASVLARYVEDLLQPELDNKEAYLDFISPEHPILTRIATKLDLDAEYVYERIRRRFWTQPTRCLPKVRPKRRTR